MSTRDWNALNQGQKSRYLARGRSLGWSSQKVIGYYRSGGNLAELRGHARTPERPERATRRPERYGGYLAQHPAYEVRPPGERRRFPAFTQEDNIVVSDMWTNGEMSLIGTHWNHLKNLVYNGRWDIYDAQTKALGRIGGHAGLPRYHFIRDRATIRAFFRQSEHLPFETLYSFADYITR